MATVYTRILKQIVQPAKVGESTPAHLPVADLASPNISSFNGGLTFVNTLGNAGGPIGYSVVSNSPSTQTYIAEEEQNIGEWVQLNATNGTATKVFGTPDSQRNLGIVSSIAVDPNGNQITSGGVPVLVQFEGDGYAFYSGTVNAGDFLKPSTSVDGKVQATTFIPASPTPVIGKALEDGGTTFTGKVLMRIEMSGE